MEPEYEFYIFSAEKLASFIKNDLETIVSVHELNHKVCMMGIGYDKINQEVFAKVKTTMSETVAIIHCDFFKQGQLEEIVGRFRDNLPQILEQIKPVNMNQNLIESISVEDFISTLPTPTKTYSKHSKYEKREFHRRFF